MKSKLRKARFVPLAFIMGIEGFCLLAPYLLLFLAFAFAVRTWQTRAALVVS